MNPRDYESYDEYRAAMEEQEWQQDQQDDPDGSKAEEEQERLEIWARFYQEGHAPRCIPSCRKPLCLQREGCIWVELQLIQDLCRDWYFEDTWSDTYLLVDRDSPDEHKKRGLCSVLPPAWQKHNSYENRVLRFFLDVWDLTSLEEETPELIKFCRDVYHFAMEALRDVPWPEREIGHDRMKHFLQRNMSLPKIASLILAVPER